MSIYLHRTRFSTFHVQGLFFQEALILLYITYIYVWWNSCIMPSNSSSFFVINRSTQHAKWQMIAVFLSVDAVSSVLSIKVCASQPSVKKSMHLHVDFPASNNDNVLHDCCSIKVNCWMKVSTIYCQL